MANFNLFKKLFGPKYKVGGHRPDPQLGFTSFDKDQLFGSSSLYPGDVDLRPFSSPLHDQKSSNSCVAQSLIKALEIKRIQKYGHQAHVPLSVLDLYFGARDKMDPKETHLDNGTQIYWGAEVLKTVGVCREEMHQFSLDNIYTPPSILATREARLNRIKNSYRIQTTGWERVDDCLANLRVGNPVVFGTAVGDNWVYNSGSVINPTKWKDTRGRHAICLVGYINDKFVIENSWGATWGDNGYGWLAPEVLADSESQDFWVIITGSEAWYEGKSI